MVHSLLTFWLDKPTWNLWHELGLGVPCALDRHCKMGALGHLIQLFSLEIMEEYYCEAIFFPLIL